MMNSHTLTNVIAKYVPCSVPTVAARTLNTVYAEQIYMNILFDCTNYKNF